MPGGLIINKQSLFKPTSIVLKGKAIFISVIAVYHQSIDVIHRKRNVVYTIAFLQLSKSRLFSIFTCLTTTYLPIMQYALAHFFNRKSPLKIHGKISGERETKMPENIYLEKIIVTQAGAASSN